MLLLKVRKSVVAALKTTSVKSLPRNSNGNIQDVCSGRRCPTSPLRADRAYLSAPPRAASPTSCSRAQYLAAGCPRGERCPGWEAQLWTLRCGRLCWLWWEGDKWNSSGWTPPTVGCWRCAVQLKLTIPGTPCSPRICSKMSRDNFPMWLSKKRGREGAKISQTRAKVVLK